MTEENAQLIGATSLLIALKIHVLTLLTKECINMKVDSLVEYLFDETSTSEQNNKNLEDAKKFLLNYEYKFLKVSRCLT
jgi:hypothetical protein